MRKFIPLLLLLPLMLGLWSAPRVLAQPPEKPVLVVGLSEVDYPPYYRTGAQGLEGAAISIIEDLAAELGYQLEYHRYPWKRVQRNLQIGLVDLVLIYYKTPARDEHALFLQQPYLSGAVSLFVSSELDLEFNGDLNALPDYPLFGVRGYFYGQQHARLPARKKAEVRDEAELVRRVANPHVKMIGVGYAESVRHYARQQGLEEQIRFLSPSLFIGNNYIAFSRARLDAERLAGRFSDALQRYMQSPRYQQVLERYQAHAPR